MSDVSNVEFKYFDWFDLDDLESNLLSLVFVHTTKTAFFNGHFELLNILAESFEAGSVAKKNALRLAFGYRDLAVLLQEPGDGEDEFDHQESLPLTIEFIDDQLKEVSKMRIWQNTCLLDIRAFRSRVIRQTETKEMREDKDNMAYCTTEKILEEMKPKVLVVCQCETAKVEHKFAQSMSSSITKCGHISTHKFHDGSEAIVIYSLHPMYALKYSHDLDPMVGRLRRAMIKFTFLQAFTILGGGLIHGPGESKLRDAIFGASRKPHLLLPTGKLNPNLDDRFKGIFLSPQATPEFKRCFDEGLREQREAVRVVEMVMQLFASS